MKEPKKIKYVILGLKQIYFNLQTQKEQQNRKLRRQGNRRFSRRRGTPATRINPETGRARSAIVKVNKRPISVAPAEGNDQEIQARQGRPISAAQSVRSC